MATLTIEGKRVTVDDAFKQMSPEQQAAAVEEIAAQIGVKKTAAQGPDGRDGRGVFEKIDAGVRGAADALTFGFADEISAGLGSGFGLVSDYNEALARQRGIDKFDQENNSMSRLGGQIVGGVAGGAGLARGGLSLSANAINKGASLARVAGAGAIEGAGLGALQGLGSGEGVAGRASSAGLGAVTGGVAGGAAPYIIAGATAAAKPLIAPVMSRLRPAEYANKAVSDGLRRAGMNADDVAASLSRAGVDGQDMFTVADAMGPAGQRMLTPIARTPNDARQTVINTLQNRQMGQGERLSAALAKGFNASDTAAQRASALTAGRTSLANINYENARGSAKIVDLSAAVNKIDDLLGRNPILGDSALSRGELGRRLSAIRSQINKGGEQLVDFDRILQLKADMFQQMQRNPDAAADLRPVYKLLDAALEKASPQYRAANDAFRAQSRTIDAVDLGKQAASGRVRASDSTATFKGLQPGEKAAFRAGYVDPLIARVESTSISPTTNKARPLMSGKTAQEFDAFVIPQRGRQMRDSILREQRMFETANAALGGSKTADNLADAAELSNFDPGVMRNLLQGRPVAAAIDGVIGLINQAKGMSPGVLNEIAKTLLETRPDVARQVLGNAMKAGAKNDAQRALANAILISMSSAGGGRLPQ